MRTLLAQCLMGRMTARSPGWRATILLGCLLCSVGCGASSATIGVPASPTSSRHEASLVSGTDVHHLGPSTTITFAPGTSYTSALRTVTDIGLQPLPFCAGAASNTTPWQPVGQEQAFEVGPLADTLQVVTTPLSPVGWFETLQQEPLVSQLYNGVYHCQAQPSDLTPVPGTRYFQGAHASVTYIQVQFTASAGSYEAGLVGISNLGFRLADPCAERKVPVPGPLVGEEERFSISRSLILATTEATSNAWQEQLQTLPGIGRYSEIRSRC